MTSVHPDSDRDVELAATAVELQGVTKSYATPAGRVDALLDIDLTVNRGEFVEVRGHSGAGKSTLLALVGGLATPTAGTVRALGMPLSDWNAAQRSAFRARHVGFVFQLFHLLPYLNVRDNVLVASPGKVDGATRDRADALLEELGLAERRTHRPSQLSAGERQRVALARALLNDPELLLADEPTGNLDAENAEIVNARLNIFHRDGGTIILVTHDDRAQAEQRRIIRLDHGRVVSPVVAEDGRQPSSDEAFGRIGE